MDKRKLTIIITFSLVFLIVVTSCILAYLKLVENIELKNKNLKVVIYQYYLNIDKINEEPVIYATFAINNETKYDNKIFALEKKEDFNIIHIDKGIIEVIESNCANHNCMHTIIDINNKDFSLLNPNTTTIECRPHGLKIVLEEIK